MVYRCSMQNIAAPRSANVILKLTGKNKKCPYHTNKIIKGIIVVFGCRTFKQVKLNLHLNVQAETFHNHSNIFDRTVSGRNRMFTDSHDCVYHGHAHAWPHFFRSAILSWLFGRSENKDSCYLVSSVPRTDSLVLFTDGRVKPPATLLNDYIYHQPTVLLSSLRNFIHHSAFGRQRSRVRSLIITNKWCSVLWGNRNRKAASLSHFRVHHDVRKLSFNWSLTCEEQNNNNNNKNAVWKWVVRHAVSEFKTVLISWIDKERVDTEP